MAVARAAMGKERGARAESARTTRKDVAVFIGRKFRRTWLPALLVAGVWYSARAETPEADAVRVMKPPVIDGKLDDDAWAKVPAVSLRKSDGNAPAEATSACFACDDDHFYVAIRCAESQMDKLQTSITKAEPENLADMWSRDDNVEVFLGPDLDGESYIQIMINPLGIAYDMKAEMYRGGDPRVDLPMQVKAHRGTTEWTVEVALPYCGLGYGRDIGPVWGVNICRYEQRLREMTQWSSATDYHLPRQFGRVTVPVELGHLIDLKDLVPGQGAPGTNTLSANVRHSLMNDRSVEIVAEVVSETDSSKDFRARAELKSQVWTPFGLEYEAGKGCYQVRLSIRDEETGRIGLQQILGPFKTRPPIELRLLRPWYRNTIYFSTPIKNVVCEVRANLDASELRRLRLEVRITKENGYVAGKVRERPRGVVNQLSLPAEKLTYGNYTVKALLKKGKAVLAEASCGLRKVPPFRTEVVLDQEMRLLVGGQAYFPVGIWGGFAGTPEMKEAGGEAAEAGFSCYASGQPRLVGPAQHVLKLKDDQFKALQSDPLVLGWYTHDEPEIHGPSATPKILREEYQEAVKKDPYHPLFIVHCPIGLDAYNTYAGCQDVVMADIYARFIDGGGPKNPAFLERIAAWMKVAREASAGREPVITVLPNFGSQVVGDMGPFDPRSRVATLKEQRAMAYTSVIHGARGLLWFLYYSGSPWYARYTPNVPRSWEALKALAGELRYLDRALLAADRSSVLEIENSGDKVYATLRRAGRDTYLIAVSPEPTKQAVRFVIRGFQPTYLTALSEDRRLSVRDGVFSDEFEPYGVHIYMTRREPGLKIAEYLADESLNYGYAPEEAFTLKHNLALKRNGGAANATSSTSPYYLFGPVAAIDGNPMTRWTPKGDDEARILTVTLPEERKVDRVRLRGGLKTKYVVEVLKGETWQLAAESEKGKNEYEFGPVTVRSVRLRVTTKGPVAVHELEIYGKGEMAPPKFWPTALREQADK